MSCGALLWRRQILLCLLPLSHMHASVSAPYKRTLHSTLFHIQQTGKGPAPAAFIECSASVSAGDPVVLGLLQCIRCSETHLGPSNTRNASSAVRTRYSLCGRLSSVIPPTLILLRVATSCPSMPNIRRICARATGGGERQGACERWMTHGAHTNQACSMRDEHKGRQVCGDGTGRAGLREGSGDGLPAWWIALENLSWTVEL